MSKLPHRSLACLAERYRPLMTVRLGTNLVIVASLPSTAHEILQTHRASLSGRSAPPDNWRAIRPPAVRPKVAHAAQARHGAAAVTESS